MLKNQTNQMKRPPRIGKLKVGEKTDKGFPTSVDYFIIDSDYKDLVTKKYGDRPKILNIVFPFDDVEDNLNEMYRMYVKSGLQCYGDGETNHVASTEGGMVEEFDKCPCFQLNPDDDTKQKCFPSIIMSFIITGIGVTGVWHFTTKAVFSRSNIRGTMEMVKATTGRLAGIPFYLRVEMQDSTIANNPHKFPVVSIDCAMNLEALMQQNLQIDTSAETKKLMAEGYKNTSGDGVEADTIDEDLHAVDNPKDTIQNSANDKKNESKKLSPLALKEWLLFDAYLEKNKDKITVPIYKATREWLDTRNEKVTNMKIISNFKTFKEKIEGEEYQDYHESLIKACMDTAKSDRETVIALLDQLVFRWHNIDQSKLIHATENQCLNLLEEFDEIHATPKEDDTISEDLDIIPAPDDDDLPF